MATSSANCGLECGVVAVVGHAWDDIFGVAPTLETTIVHSGLRAVRFTGDGSTNNGCTVRHNHWFNLTVRTYITRYYVYFPTLPAASVVFSMYENALTTQRVGVGFNVSTGKIECFEATSATAVNFAGGGVTIAAQTWYRIDEKCVSSANPWTMDAQVNGSALTQATRATAAADMGLTVKGIYGVSTLGVTSEAVIMDDFRASLTSADYPLGAGRVREGLFLTADDTHNLPATANYFERGDTGTDIANGDTNVFNLVDDNPIPSGAVNEADCVRIVANTPTNTHYVAFRFADSAIGRAPTSVDICVVNHEIGTLASARQIRIRDTVNATEDTIYSSTGGGQTTYRYTHKAYPTAPGGATAWTDAILDGIILRFGYSNDANPDVCFDGAVMEADFDGEEHYAAAALTASATIAAAATVTTAPLQGAAALTASATVSPAAMVTYAAAAALAASATLAAAGGLLLSGAAALACGATLAADATVYRNVTAALIASATVAAAGIVTYAAAAALTASATVSPTAVVTLAGVAALTASATLAAVAYLTLPGAATLTGSATVAAAAIMTYGATAALTANATITADAVMTYAAAAALTASVALTGAAIVTYAGAAALNATAIIAAIAFVTLDAAAALDATATIAAVAYLALPGAAALTAVVTLAADAEVIGGSTINGAAALTATATINAAGAVTLDASAALTASASLTAAGILYLAGVAALDASGTLNGAGNVIRGADAALSGSGSLSASANMSLAAEAILLIAVLVAAEATVTKPSTPIGIHALALDLRTIVAAALDVAGWELAGRELAAPTPGGLDADSFTLTSVDRDRIDRRAFDG